MGTSLCRAIQLLQYNSQQVRFDTKSRVTTFSSNDIAAMITYYSGADGHYISEADRIKAKLPILRQSTKHVGVANDGTSAGKYVTQLPFKQLSTKAAQADTFKEFPTLLMSVGKTCNNGNLFIFTKDGVPVHKEQDVLTTCKGSPILIGVQDEQGRYRIPLVQQRGQCQPLAPNKRVNKVLQQANSVYDLPSVKQAIK